MKTKVVDNFWKIKSNLVMFMSGRVPNKEWKSKAKMKNNMDLYSV